MVLRPRDLASIPVFSSWRNRTVVLPSGEALAVADGELAYPEPLPSCYRSHFAALPKVLSADDVEAILSVVNRTDLTFDVDPDSIDGMASHEFYLFSDEQNDAVNHLKGDADPAVFDSRRSARAEVLRRLGPVVDERIIPFVRQHWPDACNSSAGRACRVCSSVVRRYVPELRRGVKPHRDHEAIVTAVISLSDYGREYRDGGLYVAVDDHDHRGRQLLALSRGDAVVHRTDLLHGVALHDETSARWSLILWIRDSATCDRHNLEWHRGCAEAGDPICQFLFAGAHNDPTQRAQDPARMREAVRWMQLAAENGHPSARDAILRTQRTPLGASRHREAARRQRHGGSAFLLAQMLLRGEAEPEPRGTTAAKEAVALFEIAAASCPKARYNLGVAHLYGHGVARPDPRLAAEWFAASKLPEGLHAVGLFHRANGRHAEAEAWTERARRMGFGQPWRAAAMARAHEDDLHSAWPGRGTARGPPEWL